MQPSDMEAASGGFLTGSTAFASPTATAAPLVARDPPCPRRPKVTDQVLSACSCFFTQEHTQTAQVTKTTTVTSTITNIVTITSTTTVNVPKVRTRTLAGS